jgi:Na+-transporting methylmalonyl-CoA/oxaloacetate decarboxylase gamma subunit
MSNFVSTTLGNSLTGMVFLALAILLTFLALTSTMSALVQNVTNEEITAIATYLAAQK